MSEVFEIVDLDKFKNRCLSVLPACPKLFLCGFLWCAFSYVCNCGDDTASFYFSTGFGCGMGALIGHTAVNISFVDGYPTVSRDEIFHACAYFLAIFLGSGTTWQRIVNDTILYGMSFTEAFFFVWLMCFLLFLTVLTIMRFLNTQYTKKQLDEVLHVNDDFMTVQQRFYFDVQLSASVAMADAFFVGTITGVYSDNWLAPVFGIYDSTHKVEAMFLSGASTLSGFLLFQLFENIMFKECWVDPVQDETADAAAKQVRVKSVTTAGVALKPSTSTTSPMQSQV